MYFCSTGTVFLLHIRCILLHRRCICCKGTAFAAQALYLLHSTAPSLEVQGVGGVVVVVVGAPGVGGVVVVVVVVGVPECRA